MSGSGRTGVKTLFRRDQAGQSRAQHEAGAKARWGATREAVRRAGRGGGAWGRGSGGGGGVTRYRFGARVRRGGASSYARSTSTSTYTSNSTSTYSHAHSDHAPLQGAPPHAPTSALTPNDQTPTPHAPHATLTGEPMGEGWLHGVELEASMTAWVMAISQRREEADDWSGVTSSVRYRVDPTAFYRARLTLLTEYADIALQYELHAGLSLGDGSGSLLDLALAAPALIPALAPLSVRYQRLRFEEGRVDLNLGGAPTERQTFRTQLDEVEARWQVITEGEGAAWVTGRYRASAMPRQIYLTESATAGSQAHYDISDQLLWVPATTVELGVQGVASYEDALELSFGVSLGGGPYELRTPLEGTLLDEGHLLSASFQLGAALRVPLSELLALKVAYDLRGQLLSPLGLPDALERELREDPSVGLTNLSLGFHTVDLLNRFWLSLALTL